MWNRLLTGWSSRGGGRNPHLAEAMRILGYAQHFGVGIQIARDALARNGNPPLEFRVEPQTVLATIRRANGKAS